VNKHTPEYKNWLRTLKVGDTVCWSSKGWHTNDYNMATIKRFTPTQVVCVINATEARFRIADGAVLGSSYRYVEPVTDVVREVQRKSMLKKWFGNLSYDKTIAMHVIEAMKAAYDNAIKETPT
jgi:hypothetical protein